MKTACALLIRQSTARQFTGASSLSAGPIIWRGPSTIRFDIGAREHPYTVARCRRSSFVTALSRRPSPLDTLAQKHRSLQSSRRGQHSIGAEPGIDTAVHSAKSESRASVPNAESEIKIIDYSDQRIVEHDVTTASLDSFLSSTAKPEWAVCRWVYVNGINWDVVKCLGNHKRLHRLAIEDVLDTSGSAKVDWYDGHCFIELSLQKLVHLPPPAHEPRSRDEKLQETIARAKSLEERTSGLPKSGRNTWRTLSPRRSGMSVEQVSIFRTTDNTVITVFEHSGADILAPILKRLQSPETILRSSNDPSMLVHAVVDTIVDLSIPIAKAVSDAFGELELAVLTTPAIEQSKQVYVLRSCLALLMDNITATGSLVKILIDHRTLPTQQTPEPSQITGAPHPQAAPMNTVHISPLTQVYLQDVADHIRTISNSTHMSIRSAENLTALIFNTIASRQNESVRQLTLVSCFFLPLTFLTGYFGMNFDPMPIVNQHSDALFWLIATPVMMVTVGLLVRTRGRRYRPP